MNIQGLLPNRVTLVAFLLIAVFLALPDSTSSGQSSSCVAFGYSNGDTARVRIPRSGFMYGRITWYTDGDCKTVGGQRRVPGSGWVRAGNAADALAVCKDHLSGNVKVQQDFNVFLSTFWICSGKLRTKTKPYVPSGVTLNQTDLRLSAAAGFYSGIQFQRVGADGVGLPEVIAMGLLDAVDVWGITSASYEVCFPQPGAVVFLDAATSPRSVAVIDYTYENGFTCVAHDKPGTIVLVESDQIPVSDSIPPADPPIVPAALTMPVLAPDGSVQVALENCDVTAIENMHFRVRPAGGSHGLMPAGTTLASSARTRHWFAVSYNERAGWLSAEHVLASGDCDYPADEPDEDEG